MSWFGRKKKEPRSFMELCPDGLYDVHAHLLPGVDDGPADWDGSLAMLEGMSDLGYVCVTATPHFDSRTFTPDTQTVTTLSQELETKWAGRPPRVGTSAEILFDDLFFQEEANQNFPRLGDERTYLVELGFAPGSVPANVEEVFFKFQIKGPALVLAHPERIPDLQRDPKRLEKIFQTGAFLQLDLMSLVGRYGKEAEKLAFSLLEDGLVDLAATDLHAPKDLDTLKRALRTLADWNEKEFVRLVSSNPKNLLAGRLDEVERNA